MERADAAAQTAAAVTGTLPHGGFTLHCNEDTLDAVGKPTVYVICACGRGYAFGRRLTDQDLFGFLADHDGFVRKTSDEH